MRRRAQSPPPQRRTTSQHDWRSCEGGRRRPSTTRAQAVLGKKRGGLEEEARLRGWYAPAEGGWLGGSHLDDSAQVFAVHTAATAGSGCGLIARQTERSRRAWGCRGAGPPIAEKMCMACACRTATATTRCLADGRRSCDGARADGAVYSRGLAECLCRESGATDCRSHRPWLKGKSRRSLAVSGIRQRQSIRNGTHQSSLADARLARKPGTQGRAAHNK
jgi:hypothetical protein